MKLRRRIEIGIIGFFSLSILLHLLLLLSASVFFLLPPQQNEPPPELKIDSYLAKNDTPAPEVNEKPEKLQDKPLDKPQPPKPESKDGIMPKAAAKPKPAPQNLSEANSVNVLSNETPVHLIGEKGVDAPLLTLLGKALSKHLVYPKIAVDFFIRGRAVIGFIIHEDGRITDIALVESSKAGVLDNEALTAVAAMSPVAGVAEYVKGEKYLTVGVIFG